MVVVDVAMATPLSECEGCRQWFRVGDGGAEQGAAGIGEGEGVLRVDERGTAENPPVPRIRI